MERAIKAIIVDDEPSARNILEKFLELAQKVVVVASVGDTKRGLEAIDEFSPDVIFLDINMPEEDGLQFATRLRNNKVNIQIIFTTAYKNYAASAFSLKPLDYLVKPFGINDVFDIITKIENFLDEIAIANQEDAIWRSNIPNTLKLRTKKGYIFVKPDDVLYLKVENTVTTLYNYSGGYDRIFETISDLTERLEELNFLRVNRSVMVNLRYVERIEKTTRSCFVRGKEGKIEFHITNGAYKYIESLKLPKLG